MSMKAGCFLYVALGINALHATSVGLTSHGSIGSTEMAEMASGCSSEKPGQGQQHRRLQTAEPSPCELFDCGVGYTNKVGECSLPGGRNLGGESRADDDFRSDDEYTVVDDDWVPDDDDTTCTLELCCELARDTPSPTTSPTLAPLETPAPTLSPTPSPTMEPVAQTCSNGLPGIDANGVVCCPLACGQCGGSGCSSFGAAAGLGRESCCGSGVKASDVYCDESRAAPCIIGSRPETPSPTTPPTTPSPTPAPEAQTCSNGLPGIDANGVVCCPLACGQCGGSGCSSSGAAAGLGSESCCGSGVKASDVYCDESRAAPCIIGSRPETPSPTTATTPSPTPESAQTCSNGLPGIDANGVVCCPLACGQCGGSGCSSSGAAAGLGRESCCGSGVKESGVLCSQSGSAPCIIDEGQKCSNGLQGIDGNGVVCCSTSCQKCGGSGCSSRPGGSGSCCGGVIKSSGIQCSESGSAPCII